MTIDRRTACLGLAAAAAWSAGPARAQGKPLRLVVPYGPGGAPDILARLFAQELAGAYGTVVVENKAGAGGTLGADQVAKSAADSGVLLVTTAATHVINPSLYPNFPYDPVRDFTPVALVASTPLMLVTAASGPFRSLADLLAAARARPDAVSYASAGNGTMQHISGALMESLARVQATHVPYKGSAQVMPDLIAGRVGIMFNSVAAVAALVRGGQLRALAVTTRERLPAWPEVPTMAEAGLPGFEANAWYAVFGPPGLAPAEVQKAQRELQRVLEQPAVKERYATLGLEPLRGGPAELAELVRRDGQKWSGFLRERGIRSTD
ncbi:MAG: Bug family tripartite tricarboxylate transporter substrate binding protein [Pseudomonadota bacterium]|jgi:tripartite-type tricarboxylate transporter receptor subunit TctC|nr:tripartite tricarboxylate transporter substrate binding protein [Rubrivivax sp.]MCA3256968.1 tripartite tricarboxylate transporter substrate binding protein [Rubrivivax sp.]MCE2913371.1 tripartite tricarboxylate transporter substrate binding protein [Rubrivivax sp.]MCZ8032827.1 tripartite tricarboxylate transporter substrate binding protein [Rubrivivax sp.]